MDQRSVDGGMVDRIEPGAASWYVQTLLVGFDPARASWLAQILRRHGHEVRTASSWPEVQDHRRPLNLILVQLDEGDAAVRLCRDIRSAWEATLIAVSGHDTEAERLRALGAGCDDHLYWWHGPVEVMARIDAALRWARPSEPEAPAIEHGPLLIDGATRSVRLDGEPVHLTRKEFDLLYLVASRGGAVVDRPEILTEIWGSASQVASRTLDTHVSTLRRKVGRWVCVTVKGCGLRLGSPGEDG